MKNTLQHYKETNMKRDSAYVVWPNKKSYFGRILEHLLILQPPSIFFFIYQSYYSNKHEEY
jgi:hypothetical protein